MFSMVRPARLCTRAKNRPLVISFMAGMGGEAIVLKEFYWMTEKMMQAQKRGKIEKRTHWVGFEE